MSKIKDPRRVEAGRKGFHTRITNQARNNQGQDIRQWSKKKLITSIRSANTAIDYRFEKFREGYFEATGQKYTPADYRDIYATLRKADSYGDLTDMSRGRLQYIYAQQREFLRKKNDIENFERGYENFERRLRAKMNLAQAGVEPDENYGQRVAEEMRRVDTEFSLDEQQTLKAKFFEFYKKALEMRNAGQTESKGSPIYVEVAQLLTANRDMSLQELIDIMQARIDGISLADAANDTFSNAAGLSFDDLTGGVRRDDEKPFRRPTKGKNK